MCKLNIVAFRLFIATAISLFGSFGAGAQDYPTSSNKFSPDKVKFAAVAMPVSGPPWTALGRVNRVPGGFCSGVLISEDKVLTTASCLWHKSMGHWFHPSDLHFLAGYHLGSYIEHRRVASVELPERVKMNVLGHPRLPSNNWAILNLDRPIQGNNKIHPIKMIRASEKPRPDSFGPLVRVGFNSLRPHALSMARCSIVAFFNRKALMHNCGAVQTDSGLPILVQTGHGWRVLGLQMITYNRRKMQNTIGIALLVSATSKRVKIQH